MRFLLLAGQRRTNTSKLHAESLQGGDVWKIEGTEHKNEETQLVPLTNAALKGINIEGTDYFFSNDGGKTPFCAYSKGKAALDQVVAKQRAEAGLKPIPP